MFWSPRKVREARVRQSVKERKDMEQQLQKSETAELKKAAKLYKEKIQQEKRIAREVAKEAKEKDRAKKAAQRAAQKSARDAEKALQLSQNGKRKALQTSLPRKKRQKRVVDASDINEALEGASAALTRSTRRGRSVRLPDRYQ